MVSKISVYNDDLFKVIHSTKPLSIATTITDSSQQHNSIIQNSITSQVIRPTSVVKQIFNTKSIETPYKVSELDTKPKKEITSYTYFYTLYDKLSTKYSTRSEEVTSEVAPNAISSYKLDSTINSNGLLSIGSGAETVHLGSRELAGLTTEVNLALNSYIKFHDINNAFVEPFSTRIAELSSQVLPAVIESVATNTIESSFTTESNQMSGLSTPTIPLETQIGLHSSITRKPLKLMSSAVVIRDPNMRSKLDPFARPGVRVRVKPFTDTKSETTSSTIEEIVKSSETEVLPTEVVSTSFISSSEDITPDLTPTKKKIAVTLRRPFGGISRLASRKSQRVSVSTKPRFVVVTRTGPIPSVQSTARVKISSRVFKSPSVSLEVTPTPSVEVIEPTTTFNEKEDTLVKDVTTIPVVYGLDTSYTSVTLTSTISQPTTPLPSQMTVYETTTHTVPFTVGDRTIYTTVEETNSRVISQTLGSVDPSDAARANRFTKISNGVTLIVGDNINRTQTQTTLQPTLVTGAQVHMKDGIKPDIKQTSDLKSLGLVTLFDTRTLFTTFTYFTTFYTDDTSIISSSEQTVSNIVTIPYTHIVDSITPTTVLETSERLRTQTVYSTYTYYATLFNGSTSTITPLEEVKTEYLTFKEPITVTKTVSPMTTEQTSLITRTYFTTYTNLVTFFQGNKPVTSTLEETVSSEVVYTVPNLDSSSTSSVSSIIKVTPALEAPVLRTRSTYTTLTHYITLFSGSQTILSSIEEISPTVVTEIAGQTQTSTIDILPNIQFTHPSQSASKASKDLFSALVPTVSTHYTTHTYFTTLFSGTTSSIISREETSSSLVTLFVSPSGASSTSVSSTKSFDLLETDLNKRSKTEYLIEATPVITVPEKIIETTIDEEKLKSIQPSLRIESSSYEVFDSSIISKVFEDLKSSEGLSDEQISSVVAEAGASTTIIDGSTIVFFTNFILPSTVNENIMVSTDANNIAKGPAGDLVSSLLNNGDMSLLNSLLASRISSVRSTISPIYITPQLTLDAEQQMTAIKPGAVIELSDLLDGANLAGNIGEAIKDIVHILAKAPKGKNGTQDVDRISPSKELPPREGAGVSLSQEPVYIPLGVINKQNVDQTIDKMLKQNSNNQRVQIIPSKSVEIQVSTTSSIVPLVVMDNIPIEGSLEPNKKVLQVVTDHQKPTPLLSSKVVKTTNPSKTATSRVSSGATTIFFTDSTPNFAQMPTFIDSNTPIESTKYVTSVESTTRTLTLTTTKVYYTRDSPLTITSVLTTTIPPRTFVSTIIGSRTILGTAGETQTESVIPTQVTKANFVVSTKSATDPKPTVQRPTRKPGQGTFRAPTRQPETPKPFKTSAPRPRVPYKPPPPPSQPPILSGVSESPYVPNKRPTSAPIPKTTRPSILDIDQCKPGCNAANKEICKEIDGKYRCDCRQGFIRKDGDIICQELQNYVVVVRVMKVGESEVTWFSEFSNNNSNEYKSLAKMAKKQVDSAYMTTDDVKENYVGADVLGIDKVADGGNGVLVNLTVHLTKRHNLDEDLLREKLIKKLEEKSEVLPNPEFISADVEDVIDFDECSSDQYNDCAPSARCINEPGSYRCECMNGYPDLDISLPGRVCASEIKGCEFCHGRGDCIRDESGQSNTCRCNRMYLGRRCQINGLLLAIVLPIAAILCIVSICCIVYCCRKWRKRTISKGFRNLSSFGPTVIGGTLDRKAMLETSSESSDHLRSHVYDGPAMLPNDPNGTDSQRRRESEPSLDRSMGSMGGPYNSLPPQIVIPRARHSSQQVNYAIHRGQVYMW
ncbi:mucin-2-like [Oppia nitens]|uniref:mucin-2-like n=1 Tax=Oppia nitens TaxID=1686743 RepID=UPI0023DC572C|nr:mucin-2-like [Oppia nitens]